MNLPCKIQIKSTRNLKLPDFIRNSDPSLEEEWEEILWQEGFSPEDTAPSDCWDDTEKETGATSTFISQGIFSLDEDGSRRITYEDTDITGLEGCMTTFCLTPSGMLIMLRRGPVNTCMVFEKNHRHLCDYGAAGGISTVVLHTHSLEADVDETGGRFCVSYSMEMGGTRTEKNELDIIFSTKL